MAVLASSDYLAIQVPVETSIVVDPGGANLAVTLPALHSWMSTFDISIVGTVMIMKYAQYQLSGFVCDEIQTLT